MMKKIALAALLILGSLGYVYLARPKTDTAQAVADTVPAAAAAAKTPAVPTVAKSGAYTDGTYTGSVADAYYGNIQVQAVVANGRLSNVKVLQYPNDRSDSVQINQSALPKLVSEAISAQSANVNAVSGASDTSAAFNESLAAALKKAA